MASPERREIYSTRSVRLWEMDPSESSSRQSCLHPTRMPLLSEFFRTNASRSASLTEFSIRGDHADLSQNRELQIMRIVRHPNIVQLKAFYYSNGERVCSTLYQSTLFGS